METGRKLNEVKDWVRRRDDDAVESEMEVDCACERDVATRDDLRG